MAALYTRGRAMEIESRIARRRNQEEAMRRRWENHWNYIQRRDVQSVKRAAWFAAPSPRPGSSAGWGRESRLAEQEREEKRMRLEERRGKLRTLLDNEQLSYEKELKGMTPDRLAAMKTRVDHLKGQRQEKEKALAEEKRAEIWRANCPELRQVEVRQREKAMPSAWREQVSHKTEREESVKREIERYEHEAELERERALEQAEDRRKKQRSEGRDHAESLRRQMAEVRAREEEAVQLKAEQAQVEREQLELVLAEERREKLEEAAKRAELGRVLSQQAKAQLRRKSQRIREALELDLNILEDIAQRERIERGLETERRERARADAQWMRQVVAEQLELEKKREAELELLHKEEAARMWERREREWRREREARERLMNEVLAERQEQLREKMESLRLQQAESIEQREVLLREMEEATARTARQALTQREDKITRAEELQIQVEERRRRTERMKEEYEKELEQQRRAEEKYAALVKAEEDRLLAKGPQTKFHGRRKHAWYS